MADSKRKRKRKGKSPWGGQGSIDQNSIASGSTATSSGSASAPVSSSHAGPQRRRSSAPPRASEEVPDGTVKHRRRRRRIPEPVLRGIKIALAAECNPCTCWPKCAKLGLRYWVTLIAVATITIGLLNLIELADVPSGRNCGIFLYSSKDTLDELKYNSDPDISAQLHMEEVNLQCSFKINAFRYSVGLFSCLSITAGCFLLAATISTKARMWPANVAVLFMVLSTLSYFAQNLFNYDIARAREVYLVQQHLRKPLLIVHITFQVFAVIGCYAYFSCCICMYELAVRRKGQLPGPIRRARIASIQPVTFIPVPPARAPDTQSVTSFSISHDEGSGKRKKKKRRRSARSLDEQGRKRHK